LGLSGSSSFSGQSDGSNTSRNVVQSLNAFSLGPKWYTAGILEFLNSEQQDLSLRTTAGAALGRWFRRTDQINLTGLIGLVYTHETYSTPPDPSQPGSQITDNIEGLLALDFSFFHFKTATITSRLSVYPSLTTGGRVRLQYAPTLNLEIARNLYWSFTLYENYDSKPPVNANKNDFGLPNALLIFLIPCEKNSRARVQALNKQVICGAGHLRVARRYDECDSSRISRAVRCVSNLSNAEFA
jgi:hypothetical protein